jgi:hypothetical protein
MGVPNQKRNNFLLEKNLCIFVFNLTVVFGFILPSKFEPKTTKQKIQCFSFAPSKYDDL